MKHYCPAHKENKRKKSASDLHFVNCLIWCVEKLPSEVFCEYVKNGSGVLIVFCRFHETLKAHSLCTYPRSSELNRWRDRYAWVWMTPSGTSWIPKEQWRYLLPWVSSFPPAWERRFPSTDDRSHQGWQELAFDSPNCHKLNCPSKDSPSEDTTTFFCIWIPCCTEEPESNTSN